MQTTPKFKAKLFPTLLTNKARFKRRAFHLQKSLKTIDNEVL